MTSNSSIQEFAHTGTAPLNDLLSRRINLLGAAVLLASIAHTMLSYVVAAIYPPGDSAAQAKFFAGLSESLAVLSLPTTGALRRFIPMLLYSAPVAVITICSLLLISTIYKHAQEIIAHHARLVIRWSIIFTIVAIFSYNVLTQDIWLSVVWGRMIVEGLNPFSMPFPQEMARDLPLTHDSFSMTYGPTWALIAAAVVLASGDTPILSWLLLKLVLAASWLVCLFATSRMSDSWKPWRRCIAIVVVGWLPIGIHCGVAEGHNDVTMIAFAMLGLSAIASKSVLSPLMLAVSALTKYVTAPLALTDMVFHWRSRKILAREYLLRVLPAVALMLIAGAFLLYSSSGLRQTAAMADWKFLQPADALILVEQLLGTTIPGKSIAFSVLFFCFSSIEIGRLWRDPTFENLMRAQLSILTAILMGAVGHVFSWFFIWCIVHAALTPRYWLSWFVVGAAVVAPFSVVPRLIARGSSELIGNGIPSLLMYATALLAVALYFQLARRERRIEVSARPVS